MKNKKIKISLVLNIVTVLFTVFASIIMFTGFKFMEGDIVLESTKLGMLKFFTVDSNMFIGMVSFVFAIYEIKLIKGKISDIPTKVYILKLMATVGVSVTFLTVFCYLGPISKGGIPSMIKNSNLFFHLLIPVISMTNFAFFEKTNKLKFRYTLYGIIPSVIYSIFYLINVLIHIENGKVSPIYDWYWFVQGGLWQMAIVIPFMYGTTYLISLILWRLNKKGND